MNGIKYSAILEENLLEASKHMQMGHRFILQQDNDPKDTVYRIYWNLLSFVSFWQDSGSQAEYRKTSWTSRDWLRFAPLCLIVIVFAAAGITWFLLEVDVRPEMTTDKIFACTLRIVSHEFTKELGQPESNIFKREASHLNKLVTALVLASELAAYHNSSTVYAFGQGSLKVYFWIILDVPNSLSKDVTADSVKAALTSVMQRKSKATGTYIYDQYHVDPNSTDIFEGTIQNKQLLSSSTVLTNYSAGGQSKRNSPKPYIDGVSQFLNLLMIKFLGSANHILPDIHQIVEQWRLQCYDGRVSRRKRMVFLKDADFFRYHCLKKVSFKKKRQ
ncbi:unnamed protein product [Ranitomeya imitator]|uniref:SEA domain-containing protein n=1 Tax=Ranitomeya imitator TaxID=111125 RepID=A0ABN9L9P5_9NEOB|nr:unnamed protein product [Ranitomeya imitator]